MTARLREAQLAAMILTRLPVGRIEGSTPPIAHATWAFPVIGALVGLLMGTVFTLADWLHLPPLAAAFLALATSALATGALHEDGLADTADGFGGGATVTRKLEIMKDSRIGSYGVLALILTIGLTASAISAAGNFALFVAIAAASRAVMLLPMAVLRPARTDGLGQNATTSLDARTFTGLALGLLALLAFGSFLIPLVMLLTACAIMALARRQIGGQTGDVLGATQKLTECTGWLTAAALSA